LHLILSQMKVAPMLHAPCSMQRLFFSILSIAYIAVIFLFADSSVVSTLAPFNPYSLLHIPLYGVLTVLLIFSFMPLTKLPVNSLNQRNQRNLSREMRSLFHWDPRNSTNAINLRARYLLPGGIALIVAIADEIHQAYVPGRDASITDVLLDLVGIILVLFFFFRLLKTKPSLIH
jgi:hypothetical protein